MPRKLHNAAYVFVIAAVCFCWIAMERVGWLRGVEQESLRWRYLVRGEAVASPSLLYVDLDAATVSHMGSRPWDRAKFGEVLAVLLGPGQAKAVGVDIIFSKIAGGSLLDLKQSRQGNIDLGEIVEFHKNKIVLAAAYTGVKSTLTSEKARLPLIRDGRYDPETNTFPEAPTFPIIKFDSGLLGLANVDEALSGGSIPFHVVGFVELEGPRFSFHLADGITHHYAHLGAPEPKVEGDKVTVRTDDGFVSKEVPLQSKQTLFTLGLQTYLSAHGLSSEDVDIRPDSLLIRRDNDSDVEIPLVKSQSIEVNWLEGWDLRRDNDRVSMREIFKRFDKLVEAEASGDEEALESALEWFGQFRDKVIFLGPVDPQLKDIAPTPFNRTPVPKVALHANLYRMIEEQAFIARLGYPWLLVMTVGLSFLVAAPILFVSWGRLVSPFFLCGYGLFAFVSFSQSNLVIPFVTPLGSALSAAFLVVFIRLGTEQMQRRRIKNLFGAYVSPALVDEMIESDRDPELGGTKAEVTALFSDVEGFSAVSEELSPERLVMLMNEYLGAMTESFQSRQGTLDKYIGDAIVTMFGMPYPVEDHAARACLSAIEMQERHAELRREWAESGEWPERVNRMRTRIGLNSGTAVIGNMGSKMRFNYTMMGDSVNLAARCESGAKSYGVYTMLTETTYEAARAQLPDLFCRRLDRIVVKGRSQPVEIYELWDATVPREEAERCRERYEAALEAYFGGEWEKALAGFESAAEFEPSREFAPTTPSAVLAARCREFLREGTPENWDGVYRMQQK